ncbi:MAG: hypothetical protein ABIW94_00945 [Gemmatimonadaceae bacterium]
MALFENQNILLISPQPWEHIHISKHNYAIELARRGNTVYFLEPPDPECPAGVRVDPVAEYPGVHTVRYRPQFPFVLRFHVRPLFDRLMRRQIRRILRAIPRPIDVVWSFEFNLFSDLKAFGGSVAIFHPVDPLSEPYQVNVARSADVVFSVSEKILASFKDIGVPAWFINHGVSRAFANITRGSLRPGVMADGVVRVGFAGNLAHPPLNRAVLRRMVHRNPSVEFTFWGPLANSPPSSAEVSADIAEFVGFLRSQPNVRLCGSVSSSDLALQIEKMDCFVTSYLADSREYDRSNSHKLLEYLSTGKVVVSSRISTYVCHAELLRMPPDDDDSVLPELLADTLTRLDEFNATEIQDQRRLFALDNTYERQVDRIKEKLLRVTREGSLA